ncbi:MAG: DoxX family protein [Verrucomicrobiales bacterium]
METENTPPSPSKVVLWISYIMSAIPVLMLFMSAGMKISKVPMVTEGFAKMGFPAGAIMPIGIVELLCTVLYIIPQTAVLGAILLTGYLGGAIVTHVRAEEAFLGPLVFGVLVWGGLFLRDVRIRTLIPLRKKP